MSVGRIESYLHSDKTTPNKGGVLVKVTSDTDFGAKTDGFIAFSQKVAKMAYAFGALDTEVTPRKLTWDGFRGLAGAAGDPLEIERQELEKSLREKVTVEDIVIVLL